MSVLPGIGGITGLSGPVTGVALGHRVTDVDTASYSFTSFNFGTAASDRRILVIVQGTATSQGSSITVTIGGVAAKQLIFGVPGTNIEVGAYLALVPAGTSGTITCVFSGTKSRCFIQAWAIYGLPTTDANDVELSTSSVSAPSAPTVSTIPGHFVAASAGNGVSGGSGVFSWGNMTGDGEDNINDVRLAGAHATASGATFTPSVTFPSGGTLRHICAVSF